MTNGAAAYHALRDAIIENALTPGTKLPEDALGAQFGVSRTLIREALARLRAEGLVDTDRGRSATVAMPSPAEAQETFQVRRCLEREAIEAVGARWTGDTRQRLLDHVALEEKAAASRNFAASGRLGAEFHILLAELSTNSLLHRYVSEVASRCALILAVHGRDHDQTTSIREHRRLIELLEAADPDGARELLERHLVAVEDRALDTDGPPLDLAGALIPYVGRVR